MEETKVNCSIHGEQEFGLLCTHLAHSLLDRVPVGFHEYDAGDAGRPDGWCDACEARWELTTTEEEREQWFLDCNHKLLCVNCWDEAKELNS